MGSERIHQPAVAQTNAPAAHQATPVRAMPARGQSLQFLRVSSPDDLHEREADRVADEILRMPEPGSGPVLQRMCSTCAEEQVQRQADEEDDDTTVQTKADTTLQRVCLDCDAEEDMAMAMKQFPGAARVREAVDPVPAGGGRPLHAGERSFFEPRYGADFTGVRIHSGAEASSKAAQFRARAFTVGSHVVLGAGQGSFGTADGRRLMAHELTHVIQQGAAKTSRLDRMRITPLASAGVQRAVNDACYIPNVAGPYDTLGDFIGYVGPYEDFTKSQRDDILNTNKAGAATNINIAAHYKQDMPGAAALVRDADACNVLARIDHIVPKSLGGCNSVRNAQVLSATNNLAKSNTYPWGPQPGYSGVRILNPLNNKTYATKGKATQFGAQNVANLP